MGADINRQSAGANNRLSGDSELDDPFDWSFLSNEILITAGIDEGGRIQEPGSFFLKVRAAETEGLIRVYSAKATFDLGGRHVLSAEAFQKALEIEGRAKDFCQLSRSISDDFRQRYRDVWPISEGSPISSLRRRYFEGLPPPSSLVEKISSILKSKGHRFILIEGGQDCGKTPFIKRWVLESLKVQQSTLGLPDLSAWVVLTRQSLARNFGPNQVARQIALSLRHCFALRSGLPNADWEPSSRETESPQVFSDDEQGRHLEQEVFEQLARNNEGTIVIAIDIPRGFGIENDGVANFIRPLHQRMSNNPAVKFLIFLRPSELFDDLAPTTLSWGDYEYAEGELQEMSGSPLSYSSTHELLSILSEVINSGDYNLGYLALQECKGIGNCERVPADVIQSLRNRLKMAPPEDTFSQFKEHIRASADNDEMAYALVRFAAWCHILLEYHEDDLDGVIRIYDRMPQALGQLHAKGHSELNWPRLFDEDIPERIKAYKLLVPKNQFYNGWGRVALWLAAFLEDHPLSRISVSFSNLCSWAVDNPQKIQSFEDSAVQRLILVPELTDLLAKILPRVEQVSVESHYKISKVDANIGELDARLKQLSAGETPAAVVEGLVENLRQSAQQKRELQIRAAIDRGFLSEAALASDGEDSIAAARGAFIPNPEQERNTEWIYFAGQAGCGKSTALILFAAWLRATQGINLKFMFENSSPELSGTLNAIMYAAGDRPAVPPVGRTPRFCTLRLRGGDLPNLRESVVIHDSPGESWGVDIHDFSLDKSPLLVHDRATIVLCASFTDAGHESESLQISKLESMADSIRRFRANHPARLPLTEIWLITKVDLIATEIEKDALQSFCRRLENRRAAHSAQVIPMDIGPFVQVKMNDGSSFFVPPNRRDGAPFERLANAIAVPRCVP